MVTRTLSPLWAVVYDQGTVSGSQLKCEYQSQNKKVLEDIRDGKDTFPEYALLATVTCDSDEQCQRECDKEGCNYFARYVDSCKDHKADLYLVDEEVLKEAKYVDSKEYDSTSQKCQKSATGGPSKCRPKKGRGPT